jgi:hypothetical protein
LATNRSGALVRPDATELFGLPLGVPRLIPLDGKLSGVFASGVLGSPLEPLDPFEPTAMLDPALGEFDPPVSALGFPELEFDAAAVVEELAAFPVETEPEPPTNRDGKPL